MTQKLKYTVVDGKHDMGTVDGTPKGERKYARRGDTVEMTAEEAARFPGKFKLQAQPIPAEESAPAAVKTTQAVAGKPGTSAAKAAPAASSKDADGKEDDKKD